MESDLKELARLDAAATAGPWTWRWAAGANAPELMVPRHGMLLVMDAVRKGMGGAVVRFARRSPRDLGGLMMPLSELMERPKPRGPSEYVTPDNPDAALIPAARNALPWMLDELRRLTEQNALLREDAFKLAQLAADSPQFYNPLQVAEAKAVRDRYLGHLGAAS